MSNKPEIKDLLGLAEPATKLIEIVSGAIGTIYEPRKIKKLGVKEIPLAFNTNYQFLTDSDFEKLFDFKFGDKKPLIDWFIDNKEKGNEQIDTDLQVS